MHKLFYKSLKGILKFSFIYPKYVDTKGKLFLRSSGIFKTNILINVHKKEETTTYYILTKVPTSNVNSKHGSPENLKKINHPTPSANGTNSTGIVCRNIVGLNWFDS